MKPILLTLDTIENAIEQLGNGIKQKRLMKTIEAYRRLREWSDHLKNLLPNGFSEKNFINFNRHLHFVDYYLAEKNFNMIKNNFNDIKKNDFPKIKSKIIDYMEIEKENIQESTKKFSNKIFIVHGREIEATKELKAILQEVGLEPIVLHEKASGSRTIIEKLEKYSDVGYAFVILTPDDVGGNFIGHKGKSLEFSKLDFRARQNVVLEFGYFIGLLGRENVCCLYKGNIELPSDMHGICYVHFQESIDEVKGTILNELEAAGHKLEK